MIDKIESSILIHELQLDNKLNECITAQKRAEFSLLLSMLSQDANDFSEFYLPETITPTTETSEESLRKTFDLPKKAPLSLESLSEITSFNDADKIANNQLFDIQLQQALTPKPLAFRDDVNHVPSQVLGNTTLVCQKKHLERNLADNKTKQSVVDQYTFNAKAWLKCIQQTIVEASLITA